MDGGEGGREAAEALEWQKLIPQHPWDQNRDNPFLFHK